MARITRKELKTDKFALEVEHTVTFFGEHQKDILRYGAIAAVVAVLVLGYIIYARHQHSEREDMLAKAIQIQESPVGQPTPGVNQNFPTQEAKDEVALKAFGDLESKYPSSEEGEIAAYYLACIKADQGKLDEAVKGYKEVADKGNANYSSLAKFSLAQIYFADGHPELGESTLRDLIAHPTVYISKEQATVALARAIAPKKPAEARKLLQPLSAEKGAVGQAAVQLLGELPQ